LRPKRASWVEYGVTEISTRKQKFLYRLKGTELHPMAYFKADADAEEFKDFLNKIGSLIKGMRVEREGEM